MTEVPFWWLCHHQFYPDGSRRSTSGPPVSLKLCILGLQKSGVDYSSNDIHNLFFLIPCWVIQKLTWFLFQGENCSSEI